MLHLPSLNEFTRDRAKAINNNLGGTIDFNCEKIDLNIQEIEKLFNTRHSIRNFSTKPVSNDIIKKAIELAHKCPSACNRQGVRSYIIDKSKANIILENPNGFKSFSENISKYIIITGKISSYNYGKINQYIVSASIFAGYLSLTLHLYGLGACIIQRPVIWNENMEKLKKEFEIEDDEQIICMIGVGSIEGIIKVPISHKISIDEFAKFID